MAGLQGGDARDSDRPWHRFRVLTQTVLMSVHRFRRRPQIISPTSGTGSCPIGRHRSPGTREFKQMESRRRNCQRYIFTGVSSLLNPPRISDPIAGWRRNFDTKTDRPRVHDILGNAGYLVGDVDETITQLHQRRELLRGGRNSSRPGDARRRAGTIRFTTQTEDDGCRSLAVSCCRERLAADWNQAMSAVSMATAERRTRRTTQVQNSLIQADEWGAVRISPVVEPTATAACPEY